MSINLSSRLKTMQQNERNKEALLRQAQENVIAKYGDILHNYFLPDGFDVSSINIDDAVQSRIQEDRLPFDNEQIKEMIKMPKQAINESYNMYVKGKHVHGTLLLGEHNGKQVLFLLNIDKSKAYDDGFNKFSIKLNVLVGGKTWFELARIDSQDEPHPNFIKDGKVVSSVDEIEMIRTPHIHIASQECQLFADNADYSVACPTSKHFDLQNIDGKDLFKPHMQKFLEFANVDVKINENVPDDWHFAINNPLFEIVSEKWVDVVHNQNESYYGE